MFERVRIQGLVLVRPKRHADERGFFFEAWRRDQWSNAGVDADFVQDNHSLSTERGTIRGLHFQRQPFAQAKLVRCARGSVLDVAVDIRADSPTFGEHYAIELSAQNGLQIYIPEGFAHGFCTLEPNCELLYKCSNYYSPSHDAGVAFDDPELAIDWPFGRDRAILSEKDARLPSLQSLRFDVAAG